MSKLREDAMPTLIAMLCAVLFVSFAPKTAAEPQKFASPTGWAIAEIPMGRVPAKAFANPIPAPLAEPENDLVATRPHQSIAITGRLGYRLNGTFQSLAYQYAYASRLVDVPQNGWYFRTTDAWDAADENGKFAIIPQNGTPIEAYDRFEVSVFNFKKKNIALDGSTTYLGDVILTPADIGASTFVEVVGNRLIIQSYVYPIGLKRPVTVNLTNRLDGPGTHHNYVSGEPLGFTVLMQPNYAWLIYREVPLVADIAAGEYTCAWVELFAKNHPWSRMNSVLYSCAPYRPEGSGVGGAETSKALYGEGQYKAFRNALGR